MDFYAVLDQVVNLLRSRGRVSYRALKRQFHLDDEILDDLKEELIKAQRVAVDDNGDVLVWIGDVGSTPAPTPPSPQPIQMHAVEVDQAAPIDSPSAAPRPPEAERRQLTVLFCDLVDSTMLASQLDPEDWREVVRAYQDTCAKVIARFEGYIAQYLGDGLLVYFGWPQAHEDDAPRAVRAGLGMVEAMGSLNARLSQEHGVQLDVRLGIHTGQVVVGEIGGGARHEQLALGETPNVAARLQGLAAPNTVVTSAATMPLLGGFFACQSLGPQLLKGLPQPLEVYQVRSESTARSRLEAASRTGLTPLVGREQEVGLLMERWGQAKDGLGQVVLLSGEAGIGKSRLVQVLIEQVATEPQAWLTPCQCSPYHQHSALYPMIDLLERVALRFEREESPDQKRRKLEGFLVQYGLPLAEAVPLFAALLSLPLPVYYAPLTMSPEQQKQKTLHALLTILLRIAAQQPVLFVMEDLHWVDPSTLELLSLLVDQGPTAGILAVWTFRPDFSPPWPGRSHITQVTLPRLPRRQAAEMSGRVAHSKALPAEVVEQVVDKTDGVPLFVEELTKMVLESGLLREVEGRYELTGALPPLAIPATLHDSLMARLDRLATVKTVAQLGATIGRTFAYELLQAVAPLDEVTLQRGLRQLVEAELVYQRGMAPQATYIFKHALIQDTAYQSLLKSTRQQYHQRIAQVLAAQFPETAETRPELLAHHYTEAGLHEQAIPYWQQAAQRAVTRSAYREAASCYEQALLALQQLPESTTTLQQAFDVRMELTRRLVPLADYGSILTHLRGAEAIAEAQGDRRRLGLVCSHMTDYFRLTGHSEEAVACGERALAFATELGDFSLRVLANQRLGHAYHAVGDYRRSVQLLKGNIALLEGERSRERFGAGSLPSVLSRSYLVPSLVELGEFREAIAMGAEAIQIADAADTAHSQVLAAHAVGFTCLCKGDVDRAIPLLEHTLRRCRDEDLPLDTRLLTATLGYAYTLARQTTDAVAFLERGIQQTEALKIFFRYALWLSWLGETYLRAGRMDQAFELAQRAVDHASAHKEPGHQAYALRLLGELHAHGAPPDVDRTETFYRQALAVANRLDMRPLQAHCHLSLGKLYGEIGRHDDARAELSAAIALYRAMEMTFWLPQTEAMLAQVEGR